MPATKWTPPLSLPDLSHETTLSVDTETFDPGLTEKGPGYLRDSGFVVGVSIAWGPPEATHALYLPLAHKFGGNLDKGIVCQWLQDVLASPDRTLVFANAPYDLGWLRTLGVEVRGSVHDVQIMDPLLNEERIDGYSLNALAKRHLGEAKKEDLLNEAAKAHGQKNAKECMHLLAPKFVGPYAEADAEQTLRIYRKILTIPEWQEVATLYETVERPLIRTLFEMTWKGVRVDLDYADQLNERWKKQEKETYAKLGFANVWDGAACARYLRDNGINVGKTVDKAFLESISHPGGKLIRIARELNRCRDTFLEQNILRGSRAGRIHPTYMQLASDEGGTRSGRLACKNPNAQQFPKRSVNIDAKSIRKCLIPEEGKQWAKLDYWSQEPVIQCHYALLGDLPGAYEVNEMFKKDIKLATYISEKSGGWLSYDQAKDVTLARSYGQQTAGLARRMNMTMSEAEQLQEDFDAIVPYISMLADRVKARAGEKGFIKTLLGRKQRFSLWSRRFYKEPAKDEPPDPWGGRHAAFSIEKAQEIWPNEPIERAGLYKSLNRLIQGSAADQTKLGLVRIHREIGLPDLTVHDEINKSVVDKAEALAIKEIMETCIPLRAMVRADMDLGSTWQ